MYLQVSKEMNGAEQMMTLWKMLLHSFQQASMAITHERYPLPIHASAVPGDNLTQIEQEKTPGLDGFAVCSGITHRQTILIGRL